MARKFFTLHTMIRRTIFLVALLSAPLLSQARPAAWYWWVSKTTDARVCFQTSPGRYWLREAQPFRDSHCSIRF